MGDSVRDTQVVVEDFDSKHTDFVRGQYYVNLVELSRRVLIDREEDTFVIEVLSAILKRAELRCLARLLQVAQVEVLLSEREDKTTLLPAPNVSGIISRTEYHSPFPSLHRVHSGLYIVVVTVDLLLELLLPLA